MTWHLSIPITVVFVPLLSSMICSRHPLLCYRVFTFNLSLPLSQEKLTTFHQQSNSFNLIKFSSHLFFFRSKWSHLFSSWDLPRHYWSISFLFVPQIYLILVLSSFYFMVYVTPFSLSSFQLFLLQSFKCYVLIFHSVAVNQT